MDSSPHGAITDDLRVLYAALAASGHLHNRRSPNAPAETSANECSPDGLTADTDTSPTNRRRNAKRKAQTPEFRQPGGASRESALSGEDKHRRRDGLGVDCGVVGSDVLSWAGAPPVCPLDGQGSTDLSALPAFADDATPMPFAPPPAEATSLLLTPPLPGVCEPLFKNFRVTATRAELAPRAEAPLFEEAAFAVPSCAPLVPAALGAEAGMGALEGSGAPVSPCGALVEANEAPVAPRGLGGLKRSKTLRALSTMDPEAAPAVGDLAQVSGLVGASLPCRDPREAAAALEGQGCTFGSNDNLVGQVPKEKEPRPLSRTNSATDMAAFCEPESEPEAATPAAGGERPGDPAGACREFHAKSSCSELPFFESPERCRRFVPGGKGPSAAVEALMRVPLGPAPGIHPGGLLEHAGDVGDAGDADVDEDVQDYSDEDIEDDEDSWPAEEEEAEESPPGMDAAGRPKWLSLPGVYPGGGAATASCAPGAWQGNSDVKAAELEAMVALLLAHVGGQRVITPVGGAAAHAG